MMGLASLQEEEDRETLLFLSAHTKERAQREDTARRQMSANQEEGPHQTWKLPAPW